MSREVSNPAIWSATASEHLELFCFLLPGLCSFFDLRRLLHIFAGPKLHTDPKSKEGKNTHVHLAGSPFHAHIPGTTTVDKDWHSKMSQESSTALQRFNSHVSSLESKQKGVKLADFEILGTLGKGGALD